MVLDYYPFGLKHKGYNNVVTSTNPAQDLTYQGEELTEDLGLDVYEFKWRMHDPAIGRFWQVDPLSEKFYYNSTYAFSENSTIGFIELEGLEKLSIHVAGKYKNIESGYTTNIVGKINVDIGNNNATNFYFASGDLKSGYTAAVSGSYSEESGLSLSTTESDSKENMDILVKSSLVKGTQIPDALAKMGINMAMEDYKPKSLDEALSLSDSEVDQNQMIIGILTDLNYLIENDLVDAYVDVFSSSTEMGKDKDGKNKKREFGKTYSVKAKDITITEQGLFFNGNLVISFTEETTNEN